MASLFIKELSPISFQSQLLFLVAALILTGIPHGAIDHLVEEKNATYLKKDFNLIQFIVRYILTILIYALCWFVQPEISLTIFLAISAWHFGETDIPVFNKNYLFTNLMRFIWGNLVLAFLLLNNMSEVKTVLLKIIPMHSQLLKTFLLLEDYKFIIMGILFLSFLVLFLINQKPKLTYSLYHILLPLVVLITVSQLPILLGFTLYFAFWHSIIAFKTISKYILPNLNFKTAFLNTWIKALPFTTLAFIFLILGYWVWFKIFSETEPTMLIFIFISTITLPHLVVMHGMYAEKKP